MRQLLQSVFSLQSVWITINKTWNAFKNSIAKSLVSSWSLFILIKRADLEKKKRHFPARTHSEEPLSQLCFKHNIIHENGTRSDPNRRTKPKMPVSVGLIPLITLNFRLDIQNCKKKNQTEKRRKKKAFAFPQLFYRCFPWAHHFSFVLCFLCFLISSTLSVRNFYLQNNLFLMINLLLQLYCA